MDKKFLKKLKEDSDAYEELRNEPPFKGEELVEEILPVVGDYFKGEFELDGNAIICKFANGQTFRLKAEEIE